MLTQTLLKDGMKVEIEANQLYRKVGVFLDPDDDFEAVSVYQSVDDDRKFSESPKIAYHVAMKSASPSDARKFARVLQLAATIASDIESYFDVESEAINPPS